MATIAAGRPVPLASACSACRCTLNPLNQRRLANFSANRRGYFSLYIFPDPVRAQPVRRVHRQRQAAPDPLRRRLSICPFLQAYPETTFGGDFPTEADYTDPFVAGADRASRAGWSGRSIPYSYDTVILDLPVPAPSPPTRQNWLGTDDQARDVLARVIYGFRISVLFGLTLTAPELDRRRRSPARCRATTAAGSTCCSSASSRSGPSMPTLYLLIILASVVDAELLVAAGPAAAVQLDGAGRRGARGVPARPQLRLRARGARARRRQPRRSCCATSCRTPWSRR